MKFCPKTPFLLLCSFLLALSAVETKAYVLAGAKWPDGVINFKITVPDPTFPLQDGTASYVQAVFEALDAWNAVMGRLKLQATVVAPGYTIATYDNSNEIGFTKPQDFTWPAGASVATLFRKANSGANGTIQFTEGDVLINPGLTWDVYHGRSQSNPDLRRHVIQMMGQILGLLPPDKNGQTVASVVNYNEFNLELPTADDIAGIQALYGPPGQTSGTLTNISSRVAVGTGDSVAIAGFIITGGNKTVVIRGMGPSLAQYGVSGVLSNPVLELYDSRGQILETNTGWQSGSNANAISSAGLAPQNPAESAIYANLVAGDYTVILKGTNNGVGVGLVEVYDAGGSGKLSNISTRGQVLTGDSVMIGGFIIKDGVKDVVLRGMGPSLTQYGVTAVLGDPTLELHDAQGTMLSYNDNWGDPNAPKLTNFSVTPKNASESVIQMQLSAGNYTAVLRGNNGGVGIALVEVYDMD